jgi:plasmid maintenance system antidote protein VapI
MRFIFWHTDTPMMTLKLAAEFGTTPQFWLDAQNAVDLHTANLALRKKPKRIRKNRSA